MRHCIIITTSYPRLDDTAPAGSEAAGAFVRDFSQQLTRYCKVSVVAPGRQIRIFKDGNVAVHTYRAPDKPLSGLRIHWPADLFRIVRVLLSGYRVTDSLARQSPDSSLVVALWALPSGIWARRLAAKLNARYVVWALGSDTWNLGRIPVVKSILKYVLTHSNANFADGYKLAEDVSRISGRKCEFLASARAIKENESNQPSSRPYTLGYLGRWHRNKGIDLLLDALSELGEKDWADIRQVRIAGGGDLDSLVRERVVRLQERGLPIHVEGYLDREKASAFLSSIDVLLIPSRVESIPVVLSDAIKCRCAIVGMPVGDIPLLNDRYQFGLVADEVNSSSFAQKISEIVRGDLSRFFLSRDGLLELFDVENIVADFIKKTSL